jgi:hypothetical protein
VELLSLASSIVTDLESVKSFQDLQDAAKGDAMELVRLMLNAWMIHFKMNVVAPVAAEAAPVQVSWAPLFMLLPCGPDPTLTGNPPLTGSLGGGMQGYAAQAQPPMMQAYAPQSSMPPVDEYSTRPPVLLELLLPTPSASRSPGL